MNLSANKGIINRNRETFSELEQKVFEIGMEVARCLLVEALEKEDLRLQAERDVNRFRSKGLRKTCIKTICGNVEFLRRVYVDAEAACGEPKTVYLLDEALGLSGVGLFSSNMCKLIASAVCESSYRATARQITELTGLPISQQAAWDVVQKLGEHQEKVIERKADLAEAKQGSGEIETPILYEEADGIWLGLQGKSRRIHGKSKEMKVGIAYDGVVHEVSRNGKVRRNLDNKIAFGGFMSVNEFRRKKEGLVASHFDVESIDLRVLNGDGAGWIQKQKSVECISVLDKFHRNKKITECIPNREHAALVRDMLYDGDYDALLEYIKVCIDSGLDEHETKGFEELYTYYSENKKALPGYYERGIEIPETRKPGVVHHARLGSMESNVFTLIGNRMKGRRRCWSIKGANNLALLLCAYHTKGFEKLFEVMPEPPVFEPEWIDEGFPLPAARIATAIGKGYSYPGNVSMQNAPEWLKNLTRSFNSCDGLI